MLDGAILVLDSGKGVQSQSITVDKQMKRYRVPRIAFVNKMDNPGANYERVAAACSRRSSGTTRSSSRSRSAPSPSSRAIIDPIVGKAFYFDGDDGENIREEAIPAEYAGGDRSGARRASSTTWPTSTTTLAEKFLNEEPISDRGAPRRDPPRDPRAQDDARSCAAPPSRTRACSSCSTASCTTCPTRPRSSTRRTTRTRARRRSSSSPTRASRSSAWRSSSQQDKYGQLTYFRIYQGTVAAGDTIFNTSNEMRKVRVPRMFRMHSDDREEIAVGRGGRHRRVLRRRGAARARRSPTARSTAR